MTALQLGFPSDLDAGKLELSGKSFQVVPHASSKKLVVFFSGTDRRDGRFDWWGTGRKQEAHQIYLNNGANEWYQRGVPGFGKGIEGTTDAIAGWANVLGATEIYTVGVSMGGYGAVLYGCRLNARVLAFGYDPVIRRAGTRSAKRLPPRIETIVADLKPIISRSKSQIHHYAGESDAMDLWGAMHLQGTPRVSVTTLRGVEHGGAPFIEKRYGLAKFVSDFIKDRPLPVLSEAGTATTNPGLVNVLVEAHIADKEKRAKDLDRLSMEAIALDPMCEAAQILAGMVHFRKKDYPAAIPYFANALALCPHYSRARYKLAQCLRFMGRFQQSLALFEQYVADTPKSASGYRNVGEVLFKLGRKVEAVSAMRTAYSFDVEDTDIAARLLAMEKAAARR